MAISGSTAALVRAGANKYGTSIKEMAEFTNLSLATAFAIADSATALQGNATWSGFDGAVVTIEWGDGKVETTANDGAATHTYPANGTYAAVIRGLGATRKASVTIS